MSASTEVVLKNKESPYTPESLDSEGKSGKHGSSVKNVATKKTKKKVLFECDRTSSKAVSTEIPNPEFAENSDSPAEMNKSKDDHLIDTPHGASLLKMKLVQKHWG